MTRPESPHDGVRVERNAHLSAVFANLQPNFVCVQYRADLPIRSSYDGPGGGFMSTLLLVVLLVLFLLGGGGWGYSRSRR